MALMLRTFIYLSLLAASALAGAETRLAEIAVPDSHTLAGQSLWLNGAGVRSRLSVDVYVGALYLPATSREAQTIVEMPGPKQGLLAAP